MGKLLCASLDPDQVHAVIVEEVRRLMGASFAGIMALDEGRQELTYVKGTGLSPEYLAGVRLHVGEGIAGRALAQRAPVQSAKLLADLRFVWPSDIGRPDFRSVLCAPLLAGERPLGAILVFRRDEHAFTAGEMELLTRFADHAAIAFRNARLHQELRRSYEDLRRSQDLLFRQEKMAALGQLASGLAHELNNPLAAIAGFAESLAEKAKAPEVAVTPALAEFAPRLRQIADQALRCGDLVHRLLTYARQREPQSRPVDLWHVVEDCLALMAAKVRRLGNRFEALRTSDALVVLADRNMLQQVVLNLLTNALDAVEGGGNVRVTARRDEPDPGEASILLEVADTGVGIAPDALPRLFDPFFTTKGERGTGLGLPICQSIVEQHGGTLELRGPGPGLGATATVRLPPAP